MLQMIDDAMSPMTEHITNDNEASPYGLLAFASVVFDIDSGQRLDAIYPLEALSLSMKKSVAHLALPHTNNQDEGDTQYIVRFPKTIDAITVSIDKKLSFLFGFVLFRQQRDVTRQRGYLQQAVIIITEEPYLDLYERMLQVVGPLFFQEGSSIFSALYTQIKQEWPTPVLDEPVTLSLAGTFVHCIISRHEKDYNIKECDSGLSGDHEIENTEQLENEKREKIIKKIIEEETIDVSKSGQESPSPSFGDRLLAAERKHHSLSSSGLFDNIGLYTSFIGVESCLWLLWQLAITGESLLILSPRARTCSLAGLAYTSLISPLKFQGDYRPYYTLYEADFDAISERHKSPPTNESQNVTVIGSTNPFFLKSLSSWPNKLIFPFLESDKIKDKAMSTQDQENMTETDQIEKSDKKSPVIKNSNRECVSIRNKKCKRLQHFEDSNDHAILFRRCSRYVLPDPTVLQQLATPSEVFVTQLAHTQEEPYETINNIILRRHFRRLTKDFLKPFDVYFGISTAPTATQSIYMNVELYMKPFDENDFMENVLHPSKLPTPIRVTKARKLYKAFMNSVHFKPWFNYRRNRCIQHFKNTLHALVPSIEPKRLILNAYGQTLSLKDILRTQEDIKRVLLEEENKQYPNDEYIKTMRLHLRVVTSHIDATKN